MSPNMEQAFDREAESNPSRLPVLRVKASLAAWEWLRGNFGIGRAFIYDMARLGFVLAGGAAGCMLDITQGREPCTVPGDVDFFYKGVTETFGKAIRAPGKNPQEGYRTESVYRLLEKEGFGVYSANPAARTFRKNLLPKKGVRVRPNGNPVLWGNPSTPSASSPKPNELVATEPKTANLQVVIGAERGFARWDTFAAWMKYSDLGGALAAHLQSEIDGNTDPDPDPFDDTADGRAKRGRANLFRLERLRSSVGVGAIPVWHRFDFTVTCVELDGEDLLFLPFSDEDRRKKRLRLLDFNRSPVKLVYRLAKYQAKGFSLDPPELLKFGRMMDNLPEEERIEVNKLVDLLADPTTDPDYAQEAFLKHGDAYGRDVSEVEVMRAQYQKTLWQRSALEYRISGLTGIMQENRWFDKLSTSEIEYFL